MSDIHVLITLPFSGELLERLQVLSPRIKQSLQVVRSVEEITDDVLGNAQVLYTSALLPEPESVPNLRWVQLHYASIDRVRGHALLGSKVQVTTLSGVSAPGMAEFALMAILALGHHLLTMLTDKQAKRWAEDRFERFKPNELRGSTVGIIGYGSVGREIARGCRSFGASILAIKRDLKDLEDDGYQIAGLGDLKAELPDRIYPPQALASMASLCDFLVITVPLTSETRGMISKKVFEKMKPRSYLIDLSSGGVVDHGALVEALDAKHLAGAALDVYPVEPLPGGSPLWEMPNVILSPHVAYSSPRYYEMAMDLFVENMRRYLSAQPLLNQFRAERGY